MKKITLILSALIVLLTACKKTNVDPIKNNIDPITTNSKTLILKTSLDHDLVLTNHFDSLDIYRKFGTVINFDNDSSNGNIDVYNGYKTSNSSNSNNMSFTIPNDGLYDISSFFGLEMYSDDTISEKFKVSIILINSSDLSAKEIVVDSGVFSYSSSVYKNTISVKNIQLNKNDIIYVQVFFLTGNEVKSVASKYKVYSGSYLKVVKN